MRFFAVADNREIKARKIEAVLGNFLNEEKIAGKKILDLGSGSGHIAEYFSHDNEVIAADVIDQITVAGKDSFTFKKIDTESLPFNDNSFDIVVYNHIICCVGNQEGQLREIHRVLRKNGICYFATVNRYFPVDGVTRLPLLHYLPDQLFRGIYKRLLKTDEDLFLFGYHKAIRLVRRAGFSYQNFTSEIIKNPGKYHSEYKVPFHLPVPACLSPTLVFILRKEEHGI